MKKNVKNLAQLAVVFLFGAISGGIFQSAKKESIQVDRFFRISEAYNDPERFTNPLLDCTDLNDYTPGQVLDVKDRVRESIDKKKATGMVTDAAVYFRDLNDGPWFGLNESLDYSPASLLKVPLMMAVFRQAQQKPGFLDQQVKVEQDNFGEIESYKASSSLRKGDIRTLREILGYMIKYSDNNAVVILSKTVDKSVLLQTYSEMGVRFPDDVAYQISVKNYASFFRVLYNGTFLGREYSEDALRLLSESDFNNGLVAGLPEGTKIAHKFGERDFGDGNKQLHDCGIIYANKNPYLLCVMTRGKKYDDLASLISEISKIVYEGLPKK